MDHEVRRHEKVRFRREEIATLDAMPSACLQDPRIIRPNYIAKLRRALAGIAIALAVLLVLFAGAIYIAGAFGIGSERLRLEAERALKTMAGAEVDVASGAARLSLNGSRFIGLEVPDMRLRASTAGEDFLEAGSLSFGLHLWPLLGGEVQVRSLSLADARIVPAVAPRIRGSGWGAGLKNDDSLVEPDLVLETMFGGLHRVFELFEARSTNNIQLENVEIVMPGAGARVLHIASAELARTAPGALTFAAEVEIDGRKATIEGEAELDTGKERVQSLKLTGLSPDLAAGRGRFPDIRGDIDFSLSGEEGIGDAPDRLEAVLRVDKGIMQFGDRDTFSGDVELSASLVAGTGKVEINRLVLISDRSHLAFHGAFGPAPDNVWNEEVAAYRYELVSDGSTIASADVPDAALNFVARIYGMYTPQEKRFDLLEIGVRTGQGELMGTASIDLADDRTPSLILALDVPSMPVAHVKQLWPWLSAPGARAWTLQNVYGGTVKDSWLRLSVPAGRLGDGNPLTASEVSGHFQVADTRFDVAGEIPPVRDAYGIVDFRGTDVEIALSSGTVFMPSGRTVAASNGRFTIERAHRKPLIGKLDIDVAGEAPAIVELASYPPINAMSKLELSPEDFSGEVTGNVESDIPLSRDISAEKLDWKVAFDYRKLGIAKPFDGQHVTEATGSIVINPGKAVILADARLNGLPAKLDLIEPLGGDAAERKRDIAVELDDAAREKLAPGLNEILSGPILVDFETHEEGRHAVTADLTKATLQLPWVGWKKGPGIAASASFTLVADGEDAQLEDFRLEGKTFGASGEIALAAGALRIAVLDRVRLNRGDDISLDLRRSAKGYVVTVRGEAFDARGLIKRFNARSGGREGGGKAQQSDSIFIDADVKRVLGFNEEVLSNLRVKYDAVGARTDKLALSAVSPSGGAISASVTAEGEDRSVQMQSADAGSILRFLDVYDHMQGGSISLGLMGQNGGPLRGQIDARSFWLVNEPRLRSIVSTAPAEGDGRSLNEAVRRDIDTSRVQFERGFAQLEKGEGYLSISNGVLRGPLIGSTFQGTLYDQQGNMAITGTFMPAYGLNRLFAEIPIIGQILGNGRDRGLIGITYKLAGDAKSPRLQVNPISVIAPGIFRSIFEFN